MRSPEGDRPTREPNMTMIDRDTEYLQQLGFALETKTPSTQAWIREFPELGPKFSIRVDREIQRYGISEWRVYLYGFQNKYSEVVVGHSCGHRIPLVGRLLAFAITQFHYQLSKSKDRAADNIVPMTLAMMPADDVSWLEANGFERSGSHWGSEWKSDRRRAPHFEISFDVERLDHYEGISMQWSAKFTRSQAWAPGVENYDSPREAFEGLLLQSQGHLQKEIADLTRHRQSVGEIEAKLETAQTLLAQVNSLSAETQEAP